MKNIAILTDSSISMDAEKIKKYDVLTSPLTIIHNNKEYLDEIDITNFQVNDLLRENEVLTTSQPNLGLVIEQLQEVKAQNFDHVFILPVTMELSGTYRTYQHAVEEVGLKNATLIDTGTLVGPIQHGIKVIRRMNEAGKSIEDITNTLNDLYNKTESYVIPRTLKQLKASGRISSTAATMASLLKIKPILKLVAHGDTIDKFATSRTEAKAFRTVIEDMIAHGVKPETHHIYYLHSEGLEIVESFNNELEKMIGKFDYDISVLPAVLAAHAGLETIVIQYIPK